MATTTTTLFGGGSLHDKPTLWIQDRKRGDVAGGFMTSGDTFYTRDLTWVGKNTIDGAGIKPSGSGDTLVTSGFSADFFGTGSIINSPSTGTNNQLSLVVLPVGEYFITTTQYGDTSGFTTQIYNVTDSIVEVGGRTFHGSNEHAPQEFFLSVTGGTKEFRIEQGQTGGRDFISAMGQPDLGASNLQAHADIKIYKLS